MSAAPAPAQPSDTLAMRRRVTAPQGRFDQPRWVMLRSLVLPGWGQVHNRAWVKAALVAGVEFNLGRKVVQDLRELDRIQVGIDEARAQQDAALESARVRDYNARLDQLTRRQWLLGAAVAYALLDAYIDAHFRDFGAEFDYDPALPGGRPAARARLFYRWSF